jgi:CBS domain containing-hemolysin-like protein
MSSIPPVWIWLGIIVCVVQSALFAGLNLAVFSLSQLRLQLEADGGNADAASVLELRKNSNQVLSTVVWGNIGTNVLLTLLSDSVLTGLGAFFSRRSSSRCSARSCRKLIFRVTRCG